MTKFLKITILVVVALALVSVVAAYFLLNQAVKTAVETVGPQMTKTSVTLSSVSLSPFSGSGTAYGFSVGNPDGFKGSQALSVKDAGITLEASTAFSDPLVIDAVHIDGAELEYETGASGSNLEQIIKNIEDFCGKGQPSSRKVIIKDLRIANTTVRVAPALLLGQSIAVPVPDLHLTGIGERTNGETMAEVMQEILAPLSKELAGPLSTVGGMIKNAGGQRIQQGLDAAKGLLGK